MMRWLAISFLALITGCGAANIKSIRANHSGRIIAYSPDSLAVTYSRTFRGMRNCTSVETIRGDYVDGIDTANVSIVITAGLGGAGVFVNGRLKAVPDGTRAEIDYALGTWKDQARNMKLLVKGQDPDC